VIAPAAEAEDKSNAGDLGAAQSVCNMPTGRVFKRRHKKKRVCSGSGNGNGSGSGSGSGTDDGDGNGSGDQFMDAPTIHVAGGAGDWGSDSSSDD
jgi:hypothetical protein